MHTMALVALVLSIAFGYDIAQHPVYNFVHVPKCGGSEIKYLLHFWARHVKGGFLFQGPAWPRSKLGNSATLDVALASTPNLVSIGGHMGFGLHNRPEAHHFAPRPVKYITMLRDPGRRMASMYEFNMRGRQARGDFGIKYTGTGDSYALTFEQWLLEKGRAEGTLEEHSGYWDPWSLNNSMTRQLCCFVMFSHSGYSLQLRCSATLATASCAIDNLAEYTVIGLTDYMDESITLIQQLTGMADLRPKRFLDQNRNPHDTSVDLDFLSTSADSYFSEMLRWDNQVYYHAQRRFWSDYRQVLHSETEMQTRDRSDNVLFRAI